MKPYLPAEYVSTATVAQCLGVSVSTVKRWVEDGILPAQKTAGGHRKLLLADVIELARQNNLPLAEPGFSKGRRKKPQLSDSVASSERLYRSLREGDAYAVRSILRDAHGHAEPVELIADQIVAPAMHRIGDDWQKGRIDVLHEHRATQICVAALHELKLGLESRARRERPTAVGGAVEGDYSELPSLLAEMVLLEAGWNTVNLGQNTPFASFSRALDDLAPQLIWISFSHISDQKSLSREYGLFYRQAEKRGVAVIIGGRALAASLRSSLPYTAFGDGLANLGALARTLSKPNRRPSRGRPKRGKSG